ncbi:MAG: DUF2190 domain-containing protein [Pusillimonas sp.]|nr:DUF2190 domain-containing protein [Pusillimonas sp.]|tara:strand:+ start:1511 stop:1894 length:384 start_codon:yes stop_codon:yes gene_type:complete
MAVLESVKSVTLTAGGAIGQYEVVEILSANAGEVTSVATAGNDGVGVALEAAAADGDKINVAVITGGGKCKAKAGAAVAAGVNLTTDASGRVVTAAVGNAVIGKSLSAAGAAGEILTMLFDKKANVV